MVYALPKCYVRRSSLNVSNRLGSDIKNYSLSPIRVSYLVALALLSALTLVGHLVLSDNLAKVKQDTHLAKLAVRTQMLVERIGNISASLAQISDLSTESRLRERLHAALVQLEDFHSRLLSVTAESSWATKALYSPEPAGLEMALRQFMGIVRMQLAESDRLASSTVPDVTYIQTNVPVLIEGLERVIEQSQQESERSAEQSITVETLLGGTMLLALLATGFFIFRPMERRVLAEHAGKLETANEALAASKHKLKLQYDNAPDMLLSIDLETQRIVRCNATLAANLGYTKEELIGMSRSELYAPDCREKAAAAFRKFLADGRVDDVELQVVNKNGQAIDVSLSAVHYKDPDSDAEYSDAIWRDITARKDAERAVAKRDRKLTTLYLLGEQMLLSKALHPMMHNVAYCLYETLDANCVLVCSLSRERDQVTVEAGFGIPRRCIAAEPCTIERGSLVDKALRSGGVVSVAPGEVSCSLYGIELLNAEHVSRGFACAITGAWEALGLIMVCMKRGSTSADEDMDYLQSLANLLGVAADRIQLEQNTRRDKARRSRLG